MGHTVNVGISVPSILELNYRVSKCRLPFWYCLSLLEYWHPIVIIGLISMTRVGKIIYMISQLYISPFSIRNLNLNFTAKFKFQWKIFKNSSLNLSKMMFYQYNLIRAHPIDEKNVKIHQNSDFIRKLQVWDFHKKFASKAIFFSLADFRGHNRLFQ